MLSRGFMEKSVPGGLPLRSISPSEIVIQPKKAIVQMTSRMRLWLRARAEVSQSPIRRPCRK
jgi:hypothetical protein